MERVVQGVVEVPHILCPVIYTVGKHRMGLQWPHKLISGCDDENVTLL